MDTSEFYTAGIVEKGEEIADCHEACQGYVDQKNKPEFRSGFLVLTNKRLLFVERPLALFSKSKGFDVLYSVGWNDVLSVFTSGFWLFKELHVTTRIKDTITKLEFDCGKKVEQIAKKMVVCKKNYVEPGTIEATKVVIEEANKDKDNAMVILQKRLAKGEINLEEFHKLVTRL